MALKFGDAVTLVQKSRDGTFSRVNAIVLASVIQDAARPHLKAQDGKFLDSFRMVTHPRLGTWTRSLDQLIRSLHGFPAHGLDGSPAPRQQLRQRPRRAPRILTA